MDYALYAAWRQEKIDVSSLAIQAVVGNYLLNFIAEDERHVWCHPMGAEEGGVLVRTVCPGIKLSSRDGPITAH